MSKKKAEVFDLDGTLANIKKYEKHHKHRHEGFAEAAANAPVISKNVEKLQKAEKKGKETIVLTARSGHYEKETRQWMEKHHIHPDKLIMRPSDDHETPDKDLKEKLYKKDIKGKYKVTDAYDDKKKNVKMFKKEGVKKAKRV